MLSGFCLYQGLIPGQSECFGSVVEPEVRKIDVERFESAYHFIFINSGEDGKLLGKNAVWQMIVFSRLNTVNLFLHIAGSQPVRIASLDNLMNLHQVVFYFYM